jgi:pheromone shutdown protein TraB
MYCYDESNGARLLAIDTKSVSVDDGEYMSKVHEEASDLSVPMYNESKAKGKMERSHPEFAEFCKERDQMMVAEIFGVMESGYRNVVAIVGSLHASGIENQMRIFEEKYDY